jgi:mannose-6-phosphate isomerase-like protein (cupin superfamily)
MARVFAREELPESHSVRDGRDRLDIVTDKVGVGARAMKIDRILFHPGDTAAPHWHIGSDHAFYLLYGRGTMYIDDVPHHLEPGSVLVVRDEEVHWFENTADSDTALVEYWAPPAAETHWVTDDR